VIHDDKIRQILKQITQLEDELRIQLLEQRGASQLSNSGKACCFEQAIRDAHKKLKVGYSAGYLRVSLRI